VRLVVDASVALDRCLAGGLGELRGHELHAPALLPSEVTCVLREMAWRSELSDGHARDSASILETLEIAYARPGSLVGPAIAVAAGLGWAKTSDAEYLALAQRLACPLLTLDARLVRAATSVARVLTPAEL